MCLLGRADEDDEDQAYFVTDTLNIRSGPSSSNEKIISHGLPIGTRVQPTGKTKGSWWKVEVLDEINGDNDLSGWVHSRYLSLRSPVTRSRSFNHSYEPSLDSAHLTDSLPFDLAKPVGAYHRALWNEHDQNSNDPSHCKALLEFPDGTLFFEAKMSIASDGSPRATEIDPWGKPETELKYKTGTNKGKSLNAETIPYCILPAADPANEHSLTRDLGIAIGDVCLIIYKGCMCGAVFAGHGPHEKIGETSIRTHELLPVPNPWKNPLAKDELRNISTTEGIQYYVFPGTSDIMDKLTPKNAEELILERALAEYERLQKLK